MGPKKRGDKIVNTGVPKATCKKKVNKKNQSLIRIEIPSKNDTRNFRSRVVTTQPLILQTQMTKENNDNDVQSTKPMLRSRAVLKKQANAENVGLKPSIQFTETKVDPRKPLTTDAAPQKHPVKRKATPRRQLNKTTSKTNNSQLINTTADDSDCSSTDETVLSKIRRTIAQKENSTTRQTRVTKDTKPTPANNADKRPQFIQRRLTRSSTTPGRGSVSRCKADVNDNKDKNDTKTTSNTSLVDPPCNVSKDKPINFKITFNAPKLISEESTQSPVSPECMSWTRDISTSSTTTCFTVHTDDFIRFDEKLPIVKLTEVSQSLNLESAISHKSNDQISKVISNNESNVSPATTSSPSLSSISESDSDVEMTERNDDNDKRLDSFNKILGKLTTTLKNFDIEIMNWIGYNSKESDPAAQRVNEKFYSVFKEEGQVIEYCRNIKKVLLGDDNQTTDDQIFEEPDRENANIDLIRPDTDVKNSSKSAPKNSVRHDKETEDSNDAAKPNNHTNNSGDDACNDDDDALSLFAESITGFESSRKNNSVQSASNVSIHDSDEYVPQSINENSLNANDAVTYHPTKINRDPSNEPHGQSKPGKIICEKQNADSTSVYKKFCINDNVSRKNLEDPIESQEVNGDTSFVKLFSSNSTNMMPPETAPLISSNNKAVYWQKSIVFTGVCFFNLAYSCSKLKCNFKHTVLKLDLVKKRLRNLNETSFIQEYMLMRAYTSLRRQYGMVFVGDCIRRNLTPLLLEMAMDFINTAYSKDDQKLKAEIVEIILLHLNTTNLIPYANYLLLMIDPETALCDYFMHHIAETQNFTRFKKIFICLANFFSEFKRDINYNVATSLLVRLTILPYDEPLAQALLKIIERTSRDILNNDMILHLKNQLLSENINLYNKLKMLKGAVDQPASSNVTMQQSKDYDFDHVNMNIIHTESNARYSPDTTRLDYWNKTLDTPKVKRTITPRVGPDKSAPMVVSFSNQNFKRRRNSSNESSLSNSAAAGQGAGFTRRWFQKRSLFTHMKEQHKLKGNRPTILPGNFKHKFNRI